MQPTPAQIETIESLIVFEVAYRDALDRPNVDGNGDWRVWRRLCDEKRAALGLPQRGEASA